MKRITIDQTTVVQLQSILLVIMFALAVAGVSIAVDVYHKLAVQEQSIETNQHTNALAVKDYIACLISIDRSGNIPSEEQFCLNNAPPAAK